MEVHVAMRRGPRRDLIEAALAFYIHELNLTRSRYMLTVMSESKLAKDKGVHGGVIHADKRLIGMILDSRLPTQQLIQTIAHEMVHVKQIARGRLQTRFVKKKLINVWYGKEYTADDLIYYQRPWELEAFRQERELAYRLWDVIKGDFE